MTRPWDGETVAIPNMTVAPEWQQKFLRTYDIVKYFFMYRRSSPWLAVFFSTCSDNREIIL